MAKKKKREKLTVERYEFLARAATDAISLAMRDGVPVRLLLLTIDRELRSCLKGVRGKPNKQRVRGEMGAVRSAIQSIDSLEFVFRG